MIFREGVCAGVLNLGAVNTTSTIGEKRGLGAWVLTQRSAFLHVCIANYVFGLVAEQYMHSTTRMLDAQTHKYVRENADARGVKVPFPRVFTPLTNQSGFFKGKTESNSYRCEYFNQYARYESFHLHNALYAYSSVFL